VRFQIPPPFLFSPRHLKSGSLFRRSSHPGQQVFSVTIEVFPPTLSFSLPLDRGIGPS